MQKRLLLLLALGVGLSVCAQPFGGGFRTGLNASQIAGDGMSGYHKAGFNGAFYAYYFTSETIRLQLELGYSRKGSARLPEPDDPLITQFLRRLNYVEMPLLCQYQTGKLSLEAGFSADVLTSADEKIDGYPNNTFNTNDWRKLCINGVLGLHYQLTNRIRLIVRSTNALHSIRKNSVTSNVRRFSRQFGEYNDVLFFGIGWEMESPLQKLKQ
jgi:hypothetical protein